MNHQQGSPWRQGASWPHPAAALCGHLTLDFVHSSLICKWRSCARWPFEEWVEHQKKKNSWEETIQIRQHLAAGDTCLVAISRKLENSDLAITGGSSHTGSILQPEQSECVWESRGLWNSLPRQEAERIWLQSKWGFCAYIEVTPTIINSSEKDKRNTNWKRICGYFMDYLLSLYGVFVLDIRELCWSYRPSPTIEVFLVHWKGTRQIRHMWKG